MITTKPYNSLSERTLTTYIPASLAVTVNLRTTDYRRWEYFQKTLTVTNAFAPTQQCHDNDGPEYFVAAEFDFSFSKVFQNCVPGEQL